MSKIRSAVRPEGYFGCRDCGKVYQRDLKTPVHGLTYGDAIKNGNMTGDGTCPECFRNKMEELEKIEEAEEKEYESDHV